MSFAHAHLDKLGLLKSCKSKGQSNYLSRLSLGHPPTLTLDLFVQRKRFQFQPQQQQQQAQVPLPDGSLAAPVIDPATGQMVVQPQPVFVDGQQQFTSGKYNCSDM